MALIAIGSIMAHALGYLAFIDPGERGEEVAANAHGLAAYVPLVLAILVAAVVVGLLSEAVSRANGRARGGASVRWFLVLPPLGFAAQEAIERFMHVESFPWSGLHEPAFLAGLMLQVPLGLIAFFLAVWLTRVAIRIGRFLARRGLGPPHRAIAPRPGVRQEPRRSRLAAIGWAQRAPPRLEVPSRTSVLVTT
jgi:hypothetical protein